MFGKFILNNIKRVMGMAPEMPSPPGMLNWDDISFIKDETGKTGSLIIRNIPLPFWTYSNPYDTDSMDGPFDQGHAPLMSCNRDYIRDYAVVGAWISWHKEKQNIGRFHQIVNVDFDNQGWYCKTAGMNCAYEDPYKIRLHEIRAVMFGQLNTKFIKDKLIYIT